MPTYHLHIEGQVQGVGFRPHVYREARSRHLAGWVHNGPDGVHIEINCQHQEAVEFLEHLTETHPPHSLITKRHLREVPFFPYVDFHIHESSSEGLPQVLLTPDVALCESCRKEMLDPSDRRFEYPFITCTNCGPRFSILKDLPYDRTHTSMASFQQCEPCLEEYKGETHRRLHSQTNSCQTCGVRYEIPQDGETDQNLIRDRILHAWEAGQIVAIKGIGGYMLMCDATNQEAIQTLRRRKNRPSKPFAVMFPNLESLKQDLLCSGEAERILTGPISPVTILPQRQPDHSSLALTEIAPGINTIGAMIPYAPAFEWLLSKWQKPVIATSGNISGSGILFNDETILEDLSTIADLIVVHNREIIFPQDDSVVAFGNHKETQVLMRRSRGIAPGVLIPSPFIPETPTLAMGADMKAGFAVNPHGNLIASPFLGDLMYFRPQQSYQEMLEKVQQIQQFDPELILIDEHPGYISSSLGMEMASKLEVPVEKIQHHEAHFAALLGEHGLCQSEKPVLGFIWDGTGYGSDDSIWGGEIFRYHHGTFNRAYHLLPFPHVHGDRYSKEPRLTALCLLSMLDTPEGSGLLRPQFSDQEWTFLGKLLQKEANLTTSSMGRLFDGIGCLLLNQNHNSYEGEAAILLEQLARRWDQAAGLPMIEPYQIPVEGSLVDWRPMLRSIIHDLNQGVQKEEIAYRFHISLIQLIEQIGLESGSTIWGFSGGVFQNTLLCDLIHQHLSDKAEIKVHQAFPPNDENIAFGQMVRHHITQHYSTLHHQSEYHVSGHTR